MPIPTELVGSLPRPMKLQEAYQAYDDGKIDFAALQAEQDKAAEDSIRRLEETGETYVTDGEQRESSFATYPITDTLAGTGLADNLAGDGQFFAIFDDGHHRQLPRLTGGPFRYKTFASEFVEKNKAIASKPVKQAVIAPSMLMLLYPLEGEIEGYSREQFLDDLCDEVEKDIRQAFAAGAAARLDRLHRGPAREQERLAQPLDQQGHAPGVHRPQQPRDRPLLARGAQEHRHPHLPRRRHGLGALQGGALREAAEQDVPAQRGLLPHPVRERGGQGERLPAVRAVLARRRRRRAAGLLHRRDQPARPGGRDARGGARPAARRGEAHPAGAPRRHRRLRLLPLQPRREAEARLARLRARHRDAEDRATASRAPRWRPRSSGSRRRRPGPRAAALPARARGCRHRGRPRRRPRCCPS